MYSRVCNVHLSFLVFLVILIRIYGACKLSNIKAGFFDQEESKSLAIGEPMWDHCNHSLNGGDLDEHKRCVTLICA